MLFRRLLQQLDYGSQIGAIMIDNVKQLLFTPTGIIVSVLHVAFAVGIVTCWIGVQTQILGNDPVEQVQQLGRRK